MKLHLGCGKRYIPGFVHVDVIPFDHIDLVTSVDDLTTIGDNSADLIYSCHVLEHFHRRKVSSVLSEWRRILKPNGILRLSVPDFDALVTIYQSTKSLGVIIGPLFGRQDYLYNIHYNVFDYDSLRELLESVGFRNVRRYNWKTTEHSKVDDYSQAYYPYKDQNGTLISLNVECDK